MKEKHESNRIYQMKIQLLEELEPISHGPWTPS